MNPKIPCDKNFRHLYRREIGDLLVGRTLYRAGGWNTTHRHENARLVLVLRGNFRETYETDERLCRPFTGIFRPPGEKHSEVYGEGVVCISVVLAASWLERLADFSVRLEESNSVRSRNLQHLISKIALETEIDDEVSALAIDSLLTETCIEIYRNVAGRKPDKNPVWLKRAAEFIGEHYADELSLEKIASAAGVHPVHLARVFKSAHRCTVAEYIRSLRVEAARKLLADGDLPLADIALRTGFADQSHFTKNFKRITGRTPAQFRRNLPKS
jgi:AraC family transcriptional regulator